MPNPQLLYIGVFLPFAFALVLFFHAITKLIHQEDGWVRQLFAAFCIFIFCFVVYFSLNH